MVAYKKKYPIELVFRPIHSADVYKRLVTEIFENKSIRWKKWKKLYNKKLTKY